MSYKIINKLMHMFLLGNLLDACKLNFGYNITHKKVKTRRGGMVILLLTIYNRAEVMVVATIGLLTTYFPLSSTQLNEP